MAVSPTQRTLRELEQRGCHTGIVERFNIHAGPHGKRFDLFGIFDLVSMYPNQIYGIQCCGSDFSSHHEKIMESEMLVEWLKCGGGVELWAWRKVKLKRGGKAMRWKPRIRKYLLCLRSDQTLEQGVTLEHEVTFDDE